MFETHAHYNLKNFDCDRAKLLEQIHQQGVDHILVPAIGYETNLQSRLLFDKYDWIYYSVGIHPNFVGSDDSCDKIWEEGLRSQVRQKRVVAIGETGLDYHRFTYDEAGELTAECKNLKERQHLWFHRQVELAVRENLPLVLHIRAAHEDGLAVLRQYQFPDRCPGVIHCFNGNIREARAYADMGFLFGLGGSITYGNPELEEAVADMSPDSIVLETDAPYVLPSGLPGKRNTSLNLPVIVDKLSQLMGISSGIIAEKTTKNAHRLFRIE